MKVRELRRLLNALPPDAAEQEIVFLDTDTEESYELAEIRSAFGEGPFRIGGTRRD